MAPTIPKGTSTNTKTTIARIKERILIGRTKRKAPVCRIIENIFNKDIRNYLKKDAFIPVHSSRLYQAEAGGHPEVSYHKHTSQAIESDGRGHL